MCAVYMTHVNLVVTNNSISSWPKDTSEIPKGCLISVFSPHFLLLKRKTAWKHWLEKFCIIIITISLRNVACSLNIQHHNYNFHKECRTVITNNTIITWSIRETRLLVEWRRRWEVCGSDQQSTEFIAKCPSKIIFPWFMEKCIMMAHLHELTKHCLYNFSLYKVLFCHFC